MDRSWWADSKWWTHQRYAQSSVDTSMTADSHCATVRLSYSNTQTGRFSGEISSHMAHSRQKASRDWWFVFVVSPLSVSLLQFALKTHLLTVHYEAGGHFNQKRKIFVDKHLKKKIKKIQKQMYSWLNKHNKQTDLVWSGLLCLHVADPATFLASNSVPRTLFSSESSLFV